MTAPALRRATLADAAGIAAVQVRGWWHAYQDFIDPQVLAEVTVDDRTERWRSLLEAGSEAWVADAGGGIAAFVVAGASRDGDAQPSTGEIHALYVDPPAQGAGLGARLEAHARATLRERGFTTATLWVFAENGLGRAFWESRGWEPDPAGYGREAAGWSAPAVRYRRGL